MDLELFVDVVQNLIVMENPRGMWPWLKDGEVQALFHTTNLKI